MPVMATDANAIYLYDKFGVALTDTEQHFIVKINAGDGASLMNTAFDSTKTYGGETLTVVGNALLFHANPLALPLDGFEEGGSVIAYDATSGNQLWAQTGKSNHLAWGVAETVAPQVNSQVIYLTALMDHSADPAPPAPQAPSLFGRSSPDTMGVVFLYAADLQTGALWWRTRVGSAAVRGSGFTGF
jgi:hypothetical protein